MANNSNIKNRIQKITEKKYFKFISVIPWIVFCILFAFAMIKFGYVGYEGNDDFYLGLITGGIYGEYEIHTIYNNIILGAFFAFLQRIMPGHNWTTLSYLFMIFSSYTILGIWNIYRNNCFKGYITSFIFVFATCNSLICKMNYSKTGALVLAVGFILLASSVDSEKWRSKKYVAIRILSYVIILIGSLIRKQLLFASAPIFAVIVLYIFLSHKKDRWQRLIPFAATILSISLLWGIDYISYNSDAEWKATTKYDSTRQYLLDYGMYLYSFNEDQYASMNISENDYVMLGSWQYADNSVYSVETLEKLIDIRDENAKKNQISEYISQLDLFAHSRENYLFIIYVLLFVFFVFASFAKENTFKYYLMILGLCMLEIGYLVIKGRINERAFYVPVIVAFITLMYFQCKENKKKSVEIQNIILLSIIAVFTFFASNTYDLKGEDNTFTKNAYGSVDLLEYTSSNKDNLYVMNIFSNSDMLSDVYGPLDSIEKGVHDNITLTGGWMVPSPIIYNINEKYGDRYNPFITLATNKNAYWIIDDRYTYYNDQILTYIREHYNSEAEMTLINTIGSYSIYSFTQ